MPGDNDVSRLLGSIGGNQGTYHRFDEDRASDTGVQGAPLIEAVFGRDTPRPQAKAQPEEIPTLPARPDPLPQLLGETMAVAPPQPQAPMPERNPISSLFPGGRVAKPAGMSRSLRDIRDILSPNKSPDATPPGRASGLTGLFDRLGQ